MVTWSHGNVFHVLWRCVMRACRSITGLRYLGNKLSSSLGENGLINWNFKCGKVLTIIEFGRG